MAKAKSKSQTKAKANKKVDNLAQFRNIAQAVTVVSAVAYGVLWAVADLLDGASSIEWVTAASVSLVGLTMLGGVTMGLLYALESARK